MKCLICKKEMVQKSVDDTALHYCEVCEGVWLAEGDLKQMAGLDPLESRLLKCVQCQTPMLTRVINDVEIDVCTVCESVWLDKGELEKLSGVDPKSGKKLALTKIFGDDFFDV